MAKKRVARKAGKAHGRADYRCAATRRALPHLASSHSRLTSPHLTGKPPPGTFLSPLTHRDDDSHARPVVTPFFLFPFLSFSFFGTATVLATRAELEI